MDPAWNDFIKRNKLIEKLTCYKYADVIGYIKKSNKSDKIFS